MVTKTNEHSLDEVRTLASKFDQVLDTTKYQNNDL